MTRHYFLEGLQHRAQALLNWMTHDRTAAQSAEIPAHLTAARAQIEADIAQTKHLIAGIGEQAGENTWAVERHGLMISQGQIVSGGRDDGYEAVTHHPVWGEEIRDAYARERSAGIERGPLSPVEEDPRWQAMERWSDEVFAARQAAGEIPAFSSRGSWESSRLHEPVASIPAAQVAPPAPRLTRADSDQLSTTLAELRSLMSQDRQGQSNGMEMGD